MSVVKNKAWIGAPDPRGKGAQDVYFARGHLGQFILISPEHDMVVVIFGDAKERPEMAKPVEVFYDRLLTAVRR